MDVQQDMDDIPTHRSDEKYSQRKSKKPLMEKRRRARINSCLMQLKGLVLQAMKKDTSHYSKLEKADILEMTVKHLRMLQRRQISSAVAADPTVATKYNVGFTECASEVMRYLSSVQGVNEDVRGRIIGHLDNCMQSVSTTQMLQHNVQPIHVQIPASQNDNTSPHSMFPTDRLLVQTTPRQPHSLPNRPQHNGMHMVGPQPTNMHVQGALELIQGSAFNGPVAVYLGHSGDIQNMYTVSPPQTQLSSSSLKAVDSMSSGRCNTSPNFQTPLGHCGHSGGQKFASQSASPIFSPALCALKEERVWRPW